MTTAWHGNLAMLQRPGMVGMTDDKKECRNLNFLFSFGYCLW